MIEKMKEMGLLKKVSEHKMRKRIARGYQDIYHAEVKHDEWCPVLILGGGMENCRCKPTVQYYRQVETA